MLVFVSKKNITGNFREVKKDVEIFKQSKVLNLLVMLAHAFNPSSHEAESTVILLARILNLLSYK